MPILLGSGGFRTPERVELLAGVMRSFFGPIGRLLFIPYALKDHDRYVETMIERGIHAGYTFDSIHRHPDPQRAVAEAPGIFVGGGNTFRLLDTLYHLDLLPLIRERVLAGLPFLGISAGCNVACPTIMTTNDMPIVQPPSLRALGLVPFQVNAHYFEGQTFLMQNGAYVPHYGETRDERLREFHEMNDTPVIGLWEAGLLRIHNREMELIGTSARLFRKGQAAVDVPPGTRLDDWLD